MADKIYAKGLTRAEYDRQFRLKHLNKIRARDRERHAENREQYNQKSRDYRKTNPVRVRASKAKAAIKLKEFYPEKYICREIKRKAKKRGIPFDIEPQDIIMPKVCPILGIDIKFADKVSNDNSPTVDRLIPELGYVKGNCYIISQRANRLKQDSTIEDLENIIRYIKERMPGVI